MLTSPSHIIYPFLFVVINFIVSIPLYADVVKPALIEISVNQLGQIDIEARVSIEALLTGINSQYKNTKDAPNAAEYDALRKMQSDELKLEFSEFQGLFLDQISLKSYLS